jgi:hypothetical protein
MVIPRVDVSVSMFAGTIVDMLGVVSSSIPIVDVRDTIGKAAQMIDHQPDKSVRITLPAGEDFSLSPCRA